MKTFSWVLFVIGFLFGVSGFFMDAMFDKIVRVIIGSCIMLWIITEIYPGIIRNAFQVMTYAVISLVQGRPRITKKEVENETALIKTRRF